MADKIIVDFAALDRISSRLNAAGRELDQAMSQLSRLHVTRDAGANVRISGCGTKLRITGMTVSAGTVGDAVSSYKSAVGNVSWYTSNLGAAVQSVFEMFERTENSLSGKKLDAGESAPTSEGAGSGALSDSEFRKFLEMMLLYHPGVNFILRLLNQTVQHPAGIDFLGYEFTDGHPGITAWLGKSSASISGALGAAEINGYLGKAKAEAKAEAGLMKTRTKREYKDGKWSEEETRSFLYGEAGASASVAAIAADAKGTLGNDWLGVEGEAMVAAVEGKASGTINILGLEITGEIGGYAGAAGVEGKIGIEDNKFVLEGGAAAVLGVSGGVEIGFNDTGWSNLCSGFVDFTSFIESLW